eukprot:10635-Heterococcus_DN1.PRE.1
MAAAPYQGSFNAEEEKIEEVNHFCVKYMQDESCCAELLFVCALLQDSSSVQDITTSSIVTSDDGESALAADLDKVNLRKQNRAATPHTAADFLLLSCAACICLLPQALGTASVFCKHADDERIDALCCLTTCTIDLEVLNIMITATTTAGGIHLHLWHEWYRQRYVPYQQVLHLRIRAAFVTRSGGDGTDHGTIMLWTLDGDAVSMKMANGLFVEELHCEASVSKVIVTVNNEGHTLIAACYASTDEGAGAGTDGRTGIVLWNISIGTFEKWDGIRKWDE